MKWFFKCLKQYADFGGRARRKEYWWFTLINAIIMLVLMIGWLAPLFKMAITAEGGDEFDERNFIITMFSSHYLYIYLVYYLIILVPSLAVTVRRLHDIGKSGFWIFLYIGGSLLSSVAGMFENTLVTVALPIYFIALAILIVFLVWMFTNSQPGENQWGPNPKEELPAETEQMD